MTNLNKYTKRQQKRQQSLTIFITIACNFMSLFRHALINFNKKKFLKTIRYELILIPVYLDKAKDKHILLFIQIVENTTFLPIYTGK